MPTNGPWTLRLGVAGFSARGGEAFAMVFVRKHLLVFVMVGAGIALLAAALILRARINDTARAEMQRRGIYSFQIVGTRIPCEGIFDVGVGVALQEREEEKPRFGRLCHPLNWSGEWEWHPNEER